MPRADWEREEIAKVFAESEYEKYRVILVVIADEAHRSQYDFVDGYAKHLHDALPNASFIGFTGTLIESSDRNTPAIFLESMLTYTI